MSIKLITVGNRLPGWVNTGVNEYTKRLPAELKFNLIEIPPTKRSKNTPAEKNMVEEAKKILATIPPQTHIIALDEKGKQFSTLTLANQIEHWLQNDINIAFVIGGADGLDPALKDKANECWSLSELTLPHGIARMILAEQLYRAWSVTKNHPYHRE